MKFKNLVDNLISFKASGTGTNGNSALNLKNQKLVNYITRLLQLWTVHDARANFGDLSVALLGNLSCVFNRSHYNPTMKQKYNAGTSGFMISSNLLNPWFPHLDVTSHCTAVRICPVPIVSAKFFYKAELLPSGTLPWQQKCMNVPHFQTLSLSFPAVQFEFSPHFNLLSFDNPEVSSNQIISIHYSHSCLTILCW